MQYYSAWYNHSETIKYLATVPRYRIQALDIAKERGMLMVDRRGTTKEQVKKREEAAIREVIEELMDQNGGYPKPELNQILWIQIIRFPRTVYEFLKFHLDWIWRFYILRHEYTDRCVACCIIFAICVEDKIHQRFIKYFFLHLKYFCAE